MWLLVHNDLTRQQLHCKLQTRPLVKEGALGRTTTKQRKKKKIKSGHGPQRGARYQDELVDWLRPQDQIQLQLQSHARTSPAPLSFP
jgi:hypothetical protein